MAYPIWQLSLNVETQSSLSSSVIQSIGLEVLFTLFFFPCWTILFRDILGLLKNSNFSQIGCWLGVCGVPLRPSSALLPALNQVQSAGLCNLLAITLEKSTFIMVFLESETCVHILCPLPL